MPIFPAIHSELLSDWSLLSSQRQPSRHISQSVKLLFGVLYLILKVYHVYFCVTYYSMHTYAYIYFSLTTCVPFPAYCRSDKHWVVMHDATVGGVPNSWRHHGSSTGITSPVDALTHGSALTSALLALRSRTSVFKSAWYFVLRNQIRRPGSACTVFFSYVASKILSQGAHPKSPVQNPKSKIPKIQNPKSKIPKIQNPKSPKSKIQNPQIPKSKLCT